MASEIDWTHPSVVSLLAGSGEEDPVALIERRARDMSLKAMEAGWSGPPYDPFELAERQGISVVAREELEDARLVPLQDGRAQIEFNPHRRPARIRFSVAHELGHLLFPDHRQSVQYRDASHRGDRRDDWQLELLCNIAAAELLMPAGAFPRDRTEDLSLVHLLDLRAQFGVSTEALLRRIVKLTDLAASLFAAARVSDDARFRMDYVVGSRAWKLGARSGAVIGTSRVLRRCTAVGFSDEGLECWDGEQVHVQAVGVPPYPGERFPRIVGLLRPAHAIPARHSLRYVRGDATAPRVEGPTILAHVVNNQARRWGGHGLASELSRRFPQAHEHYQTWVAEPSHMRLGAVGITVVDQNLAIANLVAQAGYGDSRSPRLRLSALRAALEALGAEALARSAVVHMPLIGTGQGGTPWAPVRDLVLAELCDRGVDVVVYVLPGAPMPEDEHDEQQLSLI